VRSGEVFFGPLTYADSDRAQGPRPLAGSWARLELTVMPMSDYCHGYSLYEGEALFRAQKAQQDARVAG